MKKKKTTNQKGTKRFVAKMNDFDIVSDAQTYVDSVNSSANQPQRRSRPVLFKYERARVISMRAEQLGAGTPALIEQLEGDGPLETAEREFAANRIPFIIRRYLPDGTAEDWRLDELGPCDKRLSHK
jgi:DNA-directed RNA polymerase I, II, and III subunit RPABC2